LGTYGEGKSKKFFEPSANLRGWLILFLIMSNNFDHNIALNVYTQQLLTHYAELVAHTNKIRSSRLDQLREWVVHDDKEDHRDLFSRLFQLADTVTAPMYIEHFPDMELRAFIAVLGLIVELFALLLSLTVSMSLAGALSNSASGNGTSRNDLGFILFLIVSPLLHLLVVIGSYRWVFHRGVNSQHSSKIHIGILLILVVAVISVFFAPAWNICFAGLTCQSITVPEMLTRVTQSGESILYSVVVFFFFLLPSLVFFLNLAWHSLIWVLWFGLSAFTYLKVFHTPLNTNQLLLLVSEEIPSDKKKWKLIDLGIREIEALETLAKTNLESTEKRLLPITFLLAIAPTVLGVVTFLWSSPFQGELSNWALRIYALIPLIASSIPAISSWNAFFNGLFIGFALLLIFVPLNTLLTLFWNLQTQNTLIQASIVTKYAKQAQQTAEDAIPSKPPPYKSPIANAIKEIGELLAEFVEKFNSG